jgi:hypothetical protein
MITNQPFCCSLEARFVSVEKKITRLHTGTLSTVCNSETRATPRSNSRVTTPFAPSASPRPSVSPVVSPAADEDGDVDVQVPAGRRFRRRVVRPAFGQALSAPTQVARRC